MTKRSKKRSVKARNPIAKDLRDPIFHLRPEAEQETLSAQTQAPGSGPRHRPRAGCDRDHGFYLTLQLPRSSHSVTVGMIRSTMTVIPSGRG